MHTKQNHNKRNAIQRFSDKVWGCSHLDKICINSNLLWIYGLASLQIHLMDWFQMLLFNLWIISHINTPQFWLNYLLKILHWVVVCLFQLSRSYIDEFNGFSIEYVLCTFQLNRCSCNCSTEKIGQVWTMIG